MGQSTSTSANNRPTAPPATGYLPAQENSSKSFSASTASSHQSSKRSGNSPTWRTSPAENRSAVAHRPAAFGVAGRIDKTVRKRTRSRRHARRYPLRDFSYVAHAGLVAVLPLRLSSGPKGKSGRRRREARRNWSFVRMEHRRGHRDGLDQTVRVGYRLQRASNCSRRLSRWRARPSSWSVRWVPAVSIAVSLPLLSEYSSQLACHVTLAHWAQPPNEPD